MYQIDGQNAVTAQPVPAPPGPNPGGFFTSGNPAAGQSATIVSADWLNAIQGELVEILAAADIEPNKANNQQVIAALKTLFAPLAGNANRPFAVGNATQPNQAVALGQVSDLVGYGSTIDGYVGSGNTIQTSFTAPCPGVVFAVCAANSTAYWNGTPALSLTINGTELSADTAVLPQTHSGALAVSAGVVTARFSATGVSPSASMRMTVLFIPNIAGAL